MQTIDHKEIKTVVCVALINENDEILTTGDSVLVFMDIHKNRPTRCPDYILDKLQI